MQLKLAHGTPLLRQIADDGFECIDHPVGRCIIRSADGDRAMARAIVAATRKM
jgi:hypothetical protein